MKRLKLHIQMFAEGDNPDVTPSTNDDGQLDGQMSFDDLLGSNKDYQSEFDRRVAKALETAKTKWTTEYDEKLQAEKNEAEKLAKMNAEQKLNYELKKAKDELAQKNNELNAINLYKTANQIAIEKELPAEYLDLINFNTESAETINATIDKLVEIRSKDMEKYLNTTLKERSPQQRRQEKEEVDPYIEGFNSYFD